MKWGSFLITILFLFVSDTLKAAVIQDLYSLKTAAESFVQSKISIDSDNRTEVSSGKLDPRLRLTACTSEIIAFMPPGSRLQGNTTVGVRCELPKPWSIYIPVKISIFQKVFVALNKMPRGQIVSESDITLSEIDISQIRGHSYINKDDIIGTKLKSTLKANQVIDSSSICLICKGDTVSITANSTSISVSMSGVALNDGSKGDKIRVQNNSSRRIIEALIVDIGLVNANI
ncbi:MAG: flagellar basal body P-ring formation protein FlgA [Gammaproteobacteria bacterium]|nr:flagellar basal body P-ring formation protein FlgA [Gammaproteobacteria bacterium]